MLTVTTKKNHYDKVKITQYDPQKDQNYSIISSNYVLKFDFIS